MKLTIIASAVLAIFLATSSAAPNPSLDNDWEDFKQRYAKTYASEKEEVARRMTWESNLDFVASHNLEADNGQHTYTVGINEYSDLTVAEFVEKMNGFASSQATLGNNLEDFAHVDDHSVPMEVDWREKGYVTPVKNQGACGSCWAFSATGSLEGQHFAKTGKLVSLSEQNLVDCEKVDHGCEGGLMEHAFDYVRKNGGLDTESSYPYTAKDGARCLFDKDDVGATVESYKRIPVGDESALKKAVAEVGPVSVAIDAGHASFQHYKAGVYYEPSCSSTLLDHGVLVVGYGTGGNKDYWLVKNSWGTTWGTDGYIKMSRDRKNNCGIATHALYPIV